MEKDSQTQNIKENIIAFPKSVFVLYLIISGNFLANLFGCKIQQALQSNMLLKHLLGFMTMYFFIVLIDQSNLSKDPKLQLYYTIIFYIIFILSTRMDYKWWIIFIISLCIIYIIQVYKDHEKTTDSEKQIYNKYQTYLTYFSGIILLLGFVVYIGKKKAEYKNNFKWSTFLLGKTECSFDNYDDIKLTHSQAIKNAFNKL